MLQTFDAPPGEQACVRRVRSNTPLQALVTLNEPVFLECARALARRTLTEGGTSESDRLVFAFRTCVGRPPDAEETKVLLSWLELERSRFSTEPAAAVALATGQAPAAVAASEPKPPSQNPTVAQAGGAGSSGGGAPPAETPAATTAPSEPPAATPPAPAVDPASVELATWTALARVLLNLDETISRQ
jgi:hypothetical protein